MKTFSTIILNNTAVKGFPTIIQNVPFICHHFYIHFNGGQKRTAIFLTNGLISKR